MTMLECGIFQSKIYEQVGCEPQVEFVTRGGSGRISDPLGEEEFIDLHQLVTTTHRYLYGASREDQEE